jgi:hypothetical protein
MITRGHLINAVATAGARLVYAQEALGRWPTTPHRIADRVHLAARVTTARAKRDAAEAALAAWPTLSVDALTQEARRLAADLRALLAAID